MGNKLSSDTERKIVSVKNLKNTSKCKHYNSYSGSDKCSNIGCNNMARDNAHG